MDTFTAWAMLEFTLIVTVALISLWRAYVYVADLLTEQRLIIPEQKSVGETWQIRFGERGAQYAERAETGVEKAGAAIQEAIYRFRAWFGDRGRG